MRPLRPTAAALRTAHFALCCALLACSTTNTSTSNGDVLQSDGELERAMAANPTLREAVRSIDGGHPWKATVTVAPLIVQTPRNRAAVLVAARAAAAWEGWSEVEKLLASETWLDSSFGGEGRELLARANLAANSSASAIQNSEAAIQRATDSTSRAVRQIYLARALDRGDKPDSAAAVYAGASHHLPEIADWLALRAAGAEREADARMHAYAGVRSAVAKARVPWTEAQARERFGDLAGAAERFAALGARVATLRLRLAMASDSADRLRVKDSLIAFLRRQPARDDARQVVQVLDGASLSLSPRDELEIARALSGPGPLPRAIIGFDDANRAGLLRPEDRLQYALVLSRSNRTRDAIAQLDSIREPAGVAGQAAYQRARITMGSLNGPVTIAALRSVADRFASDAEVAAPALYLLADLASDAGSDDSAIAAYRELYRKYPSNGRADDARFRTAILDLVHGRARPAAMAFDSIVSGFPSSNERTASRYWSGRAWKAAGDSKKAAASWGAVLADQPTSYYALASARRLNRAPWAPAASPEKFAPAPWVDSAFARIALLQRLGLDTEVRFELDGLEERAAASKESALAVANAFRSHGEAPRAIRLANKMIEQGDRDARVYRLAFPLVDRAELERQAKAQKLDAALVAGLIKQESAFDPHALSVANARGLMQVLPSVGAEIARSMRYPIWSPSLLYDPDVNLQLGAAHLAAATQQYGDLAHVLAAYNAGNTRVDRWSKKTGTDDAELFAEQIPFVETRDYVRAVQRNREMYKMLYGLR
jgi:soluble lytic murein transglycosylase